MGPNLLDWIIFMLAIFGNTYGHRPRKIIGPAGHVCSGDRTFQVSLWKSSTSSSEVHYKCGGSVLDENHILTAAHCVVRTAPSRIIIQAGCVDILYPKSIYRKVSKVHNHPNYQILSIGEDEMMINDIAILTLESPIRLGRLVTAVKLPTTELNVGQSGEMAGWGSTIPGPHPKNPPVMRKFSLTILEKEICPIPIPKTQFCAIDLEKETTTGNGDSGSPLIINNTVVGILSCGNDDANFPVFFTTVFSYVDFIKHTLQKMTKNE